MRGRFLWGGARRVGFIAGSFTLAALAVGRLPLGAVGRALGMLLVPGLLLVVLRREERRLAEASRRLRQDGRQAGRAAAASIRRR
jgi:hypothetical protein